MKRGRTLTPTKASLLMVGVGMIALMGVPGFGRYHPPEGPVTGVVRTPEGAPAAGVEVALFDDAGPALIERTQTDPWGRFAFHQAPLRFHVLARPAADTGLLNAWALERERQPENEISLQLGRGTRVTLQVNDPLGEPLEGIEVRTYDASGAPAVLERRQTDAHGRVALLSPGRAHLAVLGDQDHAPHWILAESIPDEGASFTVTLERTVPVTGRVLDEFEAPLEGIVLTAWEHGEEERWCGYARSDADGRFVLPTTGGPILLRAVDPSGRTLPVRLERGASDPRFLRLTLASGRKLDLSCRQGDRPMRARVWTYSLPTESWGWGALTDGAGRLRVAVAPAHGVLAVPLAGDLLQVEAWREEAEELELVWPDGD